MAQDSKSASSALSTFLVQDVTLGETLEKIAQAQYEENEGPCLDAWREGDVIRIDDLADHKDEYPAFVEATPAEGISSTLLANFVPHTNRR